MNGRDSANRKSGAGICVLLAKMVQCIRPMWKGLRFKIGLVLFLANWPAGYGGLALGGAMAAAGHGKVWMYFGSCVYAVSWIMLITGTLLLGKDTKDILLRAMKRKYRAWRRFRSRG